MSYTPAEKAEIRKNRLMVIPLCIFGGLVLMWGRGQTEAKIAERESAMQELNQLAAQELNIVRHETGTKEDLVCMFVAIQDGENATLEVAIADGKGGTNRNLVAYVYDDTSTETAAKKFRRISVGRNTIWDDEFMASAYYLSKPDEKPELMPGLPDKQETMKDIILQFYRADKSTTYTQIKDACRIWKKGHGYDIAPRNPAKLDF